MKAEQRHGRGVGNDSGRAAHMDHGSGAAGDELDGGDKRKQTAKENQTAGENQQVTESATAVGDSRDNRIQPAFRRQDRGDGALQLGAHQAGVFPGSLDDRRHRAHQIVRPVEAEQEHAPALEHQQGGCEDEQERRQDSHQKSHRK